MSAARYQPRKFLFCPAPPLRRFISAFLFTQLFFAVGCSNLLIITSGQQLADQNHGTRTLGARIEDRSIKNKSIINLHNSGPELQQHGIIINSYNGYVLLTGHVETLNKKRKAESIVKQIRHVRRVYNEIEVGPPRSLRTISHDLWLSMKVKAAMTFTPEFPSSHCQVFSHNGTIFLMGLLTEQQTQAAVNITKKIYGVKKIVKAVEKIS